MTFADLIRIHTQRNAQRPSENKDRAPRRPKPSDQIFTDFAAI